MKTRWHVSKPPGPSLLRLSDPPCLNLSGDATVGRGPYLSPSHCLYLTSLACALSLVHRTSQTQLPQLLITMNIFQLWSDLLVGRGSSFGVLHCDWWAGLQPPSKCTTAAEEHLVLSDATSEMENQAPQPFVQSFVWLNFPFWGRQMTFLSKNNLAFFGEEELDLPAAYKIGYGKREVWMRGNKTNLTKQ